MDTWPDHGLQALLSGAAFISLAGLALGSRRLRALTAMV
jgi:hypothetical protein